MKKINDIHDEGDDKNNNDKKNKKKDPIKFTE